MFELIWGFLTAFIVVLIATPSLIKVAKLKHLVDEPGDSRKLHSRSIPTIGGIMIFAGTIIAYSLWFPSASEEKFGLNYSTLGALEDFKYLVASMFILFFLGLKDDIIGVSPSKKLLVHMVVGFILVYLADIRISTLGGIFGIYDIPFFPSLIFSLFTYVVIVNAMNLIDGVDGLASGIGLIASLTFAYWFYRAGDLPLAQLAVGLGGALFGFLVFNYNPARIFMGDSGSLTIGVVLYVLVTKMIEFESIMMPEALIDIPKPVLAMAILSYPLIDTLRVFVYRAIRGRSPFSADKNHIHHKLLSLGLTHKQTTYVLYAFTIIIIGLALVVPGWLVKGRPNVTFLIVGGAAVLLAQVIFMIKKKPAQK